jgi:hypothetical protein
MAYALKCMQELLDMLAMPCPHQSKGEEEYIRAFIEPYSDYTDSFGNLHKTINEIGKKGEKWKPNILFSSHTDTVHRHDKRQKLEIYKGKVVTSDSTCLGADDTVGNYLMIKMIQKGIPGKYIFHRGEERGGLGSHYIAKETPEVLDCIEFAIAFDRKDTNDVVQYQNGERCCSKEFASELAKLLGMTGGDPHGTFTDTANYVDIVPECSNVSVAYWDQHSKHERCDLQEIALIEERILSADWTSLSSYEFKPEWEYEYDAYSYYSRYGNINGSMSPPVVERSHNDKQIWDLHDLCVTDPYEVAWYLSENGITVNDIANGVDFGSDNPDLALTDQEIICTECGSTHPDQTCLEFYNG